MKLLVRHKNGITGISVSTFEYTYESDSIKIWDICDNVAIVKCDDDFLSAHMMARNIAEKLCTDTVVEVRGEVSWGDE